MKRWTPILGVICAIMLPGLSPAQSAERLIVVAAAPATDAPADGEAEKELSPEEKMERRFPQPMRAGDLIGRRVLDWRDNTIGFVGQVVRTADGKIKLVVPYRPYFGWLASFDWGRRLVAVPLEAVAVLGPFVAALDMPWEEFDAAPTFSASQAAAVPPDETIRIAITRR